jgi:Tfp pilus assembly PilM family ATPase
MTTEGGREFIVSLARRDIIEEYETVCASAGAEAGIVDLATFNVINAVLAGSGAPDGDWLLVHAANGYTTVTIMRAGDLVLFRNRPAEEEGGLADLVHQTAMYYEDRLGGVGFAKAFVAGLSTAGADGDVLSLRSGLEERLGCRVDTVDPRNVAALTDRISVDTGLLDTLTPLVGLLARDRVN